jgi:hypothetical protein
MMLRLPTIAFGLCDFSRDVPPKRTHCVFDGLRVVGSRDVIAERRQPLWFALPYVENDYANFGKSLARCPVPLRVAAKLFGPPWHISLRDPATVEAIVAVPEAPVHEHREPESRDVDVRPARQVAAVETIAHLARREQAARSQLGFRVPTADKGHPLGDCGVDVAHRGIQGSTAARHRPCRTINARVSIAMARTNLASDRIRPTDHQIAENLVVVPKDFVERNRHAICWSRFEAVVLGEAAPNRWLGRDNRVGLKLKGRVTSGEVLALSVAHGRLVVEKVPDR